MTPRQDASPRRRRVRLAYLVSHPIQYQAPLLRRIAQEPDIDLTVFFGSDFSVRGYKDEGFGVDVKWDVPLLEGYRHVFLPRLRDGNDVSFATPAQPRHRRRSARHRRTVARLRRPLGPRLRHRQRPARHPRRQGPRHPRAPPRRILAARPQPQPAEARAQEVSSSPTSSAWSTASCPSAPSTPNTGATTSATTSRSS